MKRNRKKIVEKKMHKNYERNKKKGALYKNMHTLIDQSIFSTA